MKGSDFYGPIYKYDKLVFKKKVSKLPILII